MDVMHGHGTVNIETCFLSSVVCGFSGGHLQLPGGVQPAHRGAEAGNGGGYRKR